jgi:hypothetical protein
VERDKPKLESVGQTLPQLPWNQKRGDIEKFLIKASLRKGTDKIDAEGGRIIKMYYYANKELYIIIINNGGKVICLPNFVWGT